MQQAGKNVQFHITTRLIKWIALVSMFCDHFAKIYLSAVLNGTVPGTGMWVAQHRGMLLSMYEGLQYFGRLAFPLFVFLLVEGFYLTRNRWKYLSRIILFGLISEIPFDMGFRFGNLAPSAGKLVEFSYQNVMFTLAIGLFAMIVIDLFLQKTAYGSAGMVIAVLIAFAFIWLGNTLEVDYHGYGVASILIAYAIKTYAVKMRGANHTGQGQKNTETGWRILEMGLLIIPLILQSSNEAWALLDVILVAFYYGKKGKPAHKWFFYIFYPAHLLFLVILRML
jgi:hypothetical protein